MDTKYNPLKSKHFFWAPELRPRYVWCLLAVVLNSPVTLAEDQAAQSSARAQAINQYYQGLKDSEQSHEPAVQENLKSQTLAPVMKNYHRGLNQWVDSIYNKYGLKKVQKIDDSSDSEKEPPEEAIAGRPGKGYRAPKESDRPTTSKNFTPRAPASSDSPPTIDGSQVPRAITFGKPSQKKPDPQKRKWSAVPVGR